MPEEGFSRHSFLRDVAAGSTGAALASLAAVAHSAGGQEAAEPPWPLTVESYPLVEAGKPGSATTLARFKLAMFAVL